MNIRYFPIDKAIYEVSPGLRPLGTDLGFGNFDKNVFQIEDNFSVARENKLNCRKESLQKYFLTKDLNSDRKKYLVNFLFARLPKEYPEIFHVEKNSDSSLTMQCAHTGDIIMIASDGSLLDFKSRETIFPAVTDPIDAIALQVQEDIALTCRENSKNWIGMLHLCSPSHWSAADKIGLPFFEVHKPVPGIDRINRVADQMVEAMINKGPFVRFVWSFVTDERLNHHPEAPPGIDPLIWKGRSFDKNARTPFYFRVERQVTYGLPEIEASLFSIRVLFWSGHEIKADEFKRNQLLGALRSMTPESRVYKGVAQCFDDLTSWLEN